MLEPDKNRMQAVFGEKIKRPTIVNFRIDERLWLEFGKYAESIGTDRSKLINEYIKDILSASK